MSNFGGESEAARKNEFISSCIPFQNNFPRAPAPVVQTLDSAIHWINHYPLDNSIGFASVYPLDSDLSGGQRYPSFEQLGPGVQIPCYTGETVQNLFLYHS